MSKKKNNHALKQEQPKDPSMTLDVKNEEAEARLHCTEKKRQGKT